MTLLSILLTAAILIATSVIHAHTSVAYAQNTPKEKEDLFKVIVTLFGVEAENGYIVTFVTLDNMSKVKVFDAALHSLSMTDTEIASRKSISASTSNGSNDISSGMVELFYVFPSTTSLEGKDEFRACSIVVKDIRMICKTGENKPAQKVNDVQLYLDRAKALG